MAISVPHFETTSHVPCSRVTGSGIRQKSVAAKTYISHKAIQENNHTTVLFMHQQRAVWCVVSMHVLSLAIFACSLSPQLIEQGSLVCTPHLTASGNLKAALLPPNIPNACCADCSLNRLFVVQRKMMVHSRTLLYTSL